MRCWIMALLVLFQARKVGACSVVQSLAGPSFIYIALARDLVGIGQGRASRAPCQCMTRHILSHLDLCKSTPVNECWAVVVSLYVYSLKWCDMTNMFEVNRVSNILEFATAQFHKINGRIGTHNSPTFRGGSHVVDRG